MKRMLVVSTVALCAASSAHAEGKLSLYCAAQEEWCQIMARSFEEATGIDVEDRKSVV